MGRFLLQGELNLFSTCFSYKVPVYLSWTAHIQGCVISRSIRLQTRLLWKGGFPPPSSLSFPCTMFRDLLYIDLCHAVEEVSLGSVTIYITPKSQGHLLCSWEFQIKSSMVRVSLAQHQMGKTTGYIRWQAFCYKTVWHRGKGQASSL